MNKPRGFTPRMRAWAKSRDGHQCSMYRLNGGVWTRCPHKVTESHHITPRGWLMHQFPLSNETKLEAMTNQPFNIVEICPSCHRGTDPRVPDEYVVHPDCRFALKDYRKGNHGAFHDLQSRRRDSCTRGEKYWNDLYDKMFKLIVLVRNSTHLEANPFPYRRSP